jgi:hypothetical protein
MDRWNSRAENYTAPLARGEECRPNYAQSSMKAGAIAKLPRLPRLDSVAEMSTLAEIEQAVEALPRKQQQTLLRHLAVKLRLPVPAANATMRNCWPVPPPKVSKAESQRIARRIAEEFGRVEVENWK